MFVRLASGFRTSVEFLLPGFEAISHPGFGNDVARGGSVGLQFLAQLSDEDAKVFNLLRTLSAPDRAQECAVVHDLAGMSCQKNEQLELFRVRRTSLRRTV